MNNLSKTLESEKRKCEPGRQMAWGRRQHKHSIWELEVTLLSIITSHSSRYPPFPPSITSSYSHQRSLSLHKKMLKSEYWVRRRDGGLVECWELPLYGGRPLAGRRHYRGSCSPLAAIWLICGAVSLWRWFTGMEWNGGKLFVLLRACGRESSREVGPSSTHTHAFLNEETKWASIP